MSYTIDLQAIADELDFDLEDVEMLIGVFLESAKESMQNLKNGIDSNNLEKVFHSAHAIKGSAANLTLHAISDLAKFIEHHARDGENIDYAEYYKQIESLIHELQSSLS